MVFSSLIFTFIFLPVIVGLYYITPVKFRNYLLLVASLIFYAYGEPRFVFVMMASIVINYALAMFIDKSKKVDKPDRAKWLLALDVVLNIGLLFIFKYLNFTCSIINSLIGSERFITNIALPIGISFFTFQALSYVIDVYRGTVRIQKNPLYVALYIAFFPQLIAGPIVRYSTIEEQIENRTCNLEKFSEGLRRFFLGFSKKILLANNLSIVSNDIFGSDFTAISPLTLWLGAICFSLHIFYDFAAYSDMAIGLGRMFGFEFLENFNYPYISKSGTEFWSRWHISLGTWLKDYIYIPLGGSRVSIPRYIFNLFVVWFVTGIWHGANYTYIAWGMSFFVLLLLERFFIKPKTFGPVLSQVYRVFTLIYVSFTMVIFNSQGMRAAIKYCLGMVGFYAKNATALIDTPFIHNFKEYWFFIVLGVLFATPVARVLSEKINKSEALGRVAAVAIPVGYGLVFLWSVSYLVLGAHNPFIYFNF